METVLSISVRTAIGSSASARLGMPMSRRASKAISAPSSTSVQRQVPSNRAMSPSNWRKVIVSASRSNWSSSVQRSRPARKVTSHREMVTVSDTSVTTTSWTASLSSG